eukprot:8092472-Pyramimonas_sp.AAC.1
MAACRWLAHRCGRASVSARAQSGQTSYVAAVALTTGDFDFPARLAGRANARTLQCESVNREGG